MKAFKVFFAIVFAMMLGVNGVWGQLLLNNSSNSATIDFSSTITGVSNGAFTGAGFQSTPTSGQLDSDAWACTGMSDGALVFGGTRTTANSDFTRGSSSVAVTTGGFYAYTGSPQISSNPCLMIQPGGNDWTPGTLTLRMKNDGTTTITSLTISYNIYLRNDGAYSNSINFSYSSDDVTYTNVSSLDYSSPAASDANGWVLISSSPSRSTIISGLSIEAGGFFYIRWSGDDVSGSTSRDEFGLDDISITASRVKGVLNSIIASGTYDNILITGNTSLGGVVKIQNSLEVQSGILTTGSNLTLMSNVTGTARVENSSGTISGDVTVERHFASNKQAWRLVTAPVAGSSSNFIYDHWQSSTTGGATGVEIWGPTGSAAPTGSGGANGLAYHATVSSMREWNNNLSNPAYANVTNTKNTALFTADGTNPKSFFLFVAGPLGNGSVPASYSAVKVRATGTLRQGNQTFSIDNPTGSAFYLVGNPYASPVDHGNSGTSGSPSYPLTLTNTTNQIWLWDPNLSGANGVGGYVSFDRLNNAYSVVTGGSTGLSYTDGASYTRLQSGQAFFVKASASPSGNLTVAFTESSKGSSITGGVFRGQNGETSEKMRITLQRNYSGEYITTDGAVAFFYPGGAKEVNDMDGQKLMNASDNIMFRRNGTNLTFEHRPLVESNDTLFLNLRSTSTGAYRLILTGSDFDNSNKLIPVLQDTYLNKEQILKLDTSVNYDFEIDGNATASSGERFRIVFSSKAAEPLEFDPRHTIQGYPNPLRVGEQLNLKFNDRPAGNYTVVFNSLQGARVQQQVIRHAGGTAVQNIKLSSKLSSGSYLVNVLDASSRNVESFKIIIQ